MKAFDTFAENTSRRLARKLSRRNILSKLGALLCASGTLPILPMARADSKNLNTDYDLKGKVGSNDCNYWRYCAVDGYLCGCCGGTMTSCPPGTSMSPVTWIGTCRNPTDDEVYLISYNDCCGKSTCNRCFCSRSEGEKPVYHPFKSGHINWCLSSETNVYHCSTAIVVGKA